MADTIADLIERGERVTWKCGQCRAGGEVDLARLCATMGGHFSLTDRHPPCRASGCGYWVRFYAQAGLRNRSLSTPGGDDRDSDRRTEWLKRKWAARSK